MASKLPTTAGESIIGSRMIVVHMPWPRNFLSIRKARPNPTTVSMTTVQITKCAVTCIAAQMSGSVSMVWYQSIPSHSPGHWPGWRDSW